MTSPCPLSPGEGWLLYSVLHLAYIRGWVCILSRGCYCLGFLQTQGGGGFFEASQFKMRDQCLAKLRKYSLWNWYSPPPAIVTTDHKFSGLRQQKFLILFWSCHVACGILVPQPGMKLMPPEVETRSLNHWIFREVKEQQKCLTVLEFKFKIHSTRLQSEVGSAGSVGRLQAFCRSR